MGSSEQAAGKRVSDYFNHGRHTPPGTWYPGPAPEPHSTHQHKTQPLQQKGGKDDD